MPIRRARCCGRPGTRTRASGRPGRPHRRLPLSPRATSPQRDGPRPTRTWPRGPCCAPGRGRGCRSPRCRADIHSLVSAKGPSTVSVLPSPDAERWCSAGVVEGIAREVVLPRSTNLLAELAVIGHQLVPLGAAGRRVELGVVVDDQRSAWHSPWSCPSVPKHWVMSVPPSFSPTGGWHRPIDLFNCTRSTVRSKYSPAGEGLSRPTVRVQGADPLNQAMASGVVAVRSMAGCRPSTTGHCPGTPSCHGPGTGQ